MIFAESVIGAMSIIIQQYNSAAHCADRREQKLFGSLCVIVVTSYDVIVDGRRTHVSL